jgi:peptidoglycan/LPS O-acetylase OafA/YrhL
MTAAPAPAAPQTRAADHLAPLDGLRGIAIALVVWYHLWLITWLAADVHVLGQTYNFNVFPETGFVGVDLFFFISGFVLFYPYAMTLFDGRPQQSLGIFAYRRMLKIVPSYYLSIALFIALGLTHFDSFGEGVRQVLAHAFFIHDWFDETAGGINGVLWSLAVEVQFYVLFPAICWAFMRRPVWTAAALIVLANVYRVVVWHHPDVGREIDRLPGVIDLFAVGMLCAWSYRAIAVRAPKLASRRWLWTAIALLGFVLAYLSLWHSFVHRSDAEWETGWKVYQRPELDLAFIPAALGSLFAFPAWQRALANPALVFLSLISYNLYLWHQALAFATYNARVPNWIGSDPHADHTWGVPFTIVALAFGVAVAWLITVTVEQPLLRRRPFQSFFAKIGAARPILRSGRHSPPIPAPALAGPMLQAPQED